MVAQAGAVVPRNLYSSGTIHGGGGNMHHSLISPPPRHFSASSRSLEVMLCRHCDSNCRPASRPLGQDTAARHYPPPTTDCTTTADAAAKIPQQTDLSCSFVSPATYLALELIHWLAPGGRLSGKYASSKFIVVQ